MVPGFQQVKFSAPDMEDIFVDLPNTNDDSMMIHVEVKSFERLCQQMLAHVYSRWNVKLDT